MTTKILIIDDDPITRLLAAEKLTEENFRVFEAANGQQGLAMIKQIKPDLVLLDVIMPDIDGYDVCKEIRRNPELASLPVIMLTGLEDNASIVRAYDYGATDFVTKPIDPAQLLDALQRAWDPAESRAGEGERRSAC